MEIDDVFDEIEEAADALGLLNPWLGMSKGKSYEVWVLLELALRLANAGLVVLPHNNRDEIEPYFRIPGSPAMMPSSASSTNLEPCHILFGRDGHPPETWFELHLGLQHCGVSGAPHELDISVLPYLHAWASRQDGGGYYGGQTTDGLELKAFDEAHKLSHAIPRALIGVAVDLDPSWVMQSFVFKTAGGVGREFTRSARTRYALVTCTDFFDSSREYLEHHGVGAYAGVLPATTDALDEIAARLIALPAPA